MSWSREDGKSYSYLSAKPNVEVIMGKGKKKKKVANFPRRLSSWEDTIMFRVCEGKLIKKNALSLFMRLFIFAEK